MTTTAHGAGVPLELIQDARLVTRNARRLEGQIATINARRRELVAQMYEQGLIQAEIGRLLDISRQRVTQYVEDLRASGRLPAAPENPAQDD